MLNGAEYITTDTIYLRMLNVDRREHNECQIRLCLLPYIEHRLWCIFRSLPTVMSTRDMF